MRQIVSTIPSFADETVSTRDSSVIGFSPLLNATVDHRDTSMLVDGSIEGGDMELEIMVTDAMSLANLQYQECTSQLRSSVYGEELYK